jgi:hypothetical protein
LHGRRFAVSLVAVVFHAVTGGSNLKALSKIPLPAASLFAFLSLLGCQASEPVSQAQDDPGSVAGRVRTVSGEPASDATVYAFADSAGLAVDSAKTDADGKFVLDLGKGDYDLYIDRKGAEGGRVRGVSSSDTLNELGPVQLVPVIVTSVDLGLPQERIDSIRIPGSSLSGKVAADGKLDVPSLQGEAVVVKVSMKDEGGNTVSGTLKLQAVDGKMVVAWVDEPTKTLPVVAGPEGTHFGADTSTVALWSFDTVSGGVVYDRSLHGRNLTAYGADAWSRSGETALTPSATGRILYEARVKLSTYPSSSLHNGRAVVAGFYEGLKLLVTDHGQVQAGAQRGDGSWSWFAPETKDSLVPLGKWVDLAVGADEATGDVYVWIDGKAVPTWSGSKVSGSKIRIAASTFVVGKDAVDGQAFAGQISEVRVSRRFVLGEGIASGVDSCIDPLAPCPTPAVVVDTPKVVVPKSIDTLVAHWVVDSTTQSKLVDLTGNGFDLAKASSGVWSRANDTFLTQKVTGQILYQAKVRLDKYPSSSLHNGRAVVVGFYEGLKLLVNDHGQLQAGAQRGDGTWNWFAPETKDSLVPLGRWVELAVGADQKTGDVHAWIDGEAVATWSGSNVSGSRTRVATSTFVVGQDAVDGQKFDGQIAEVKVWNRFVLGEGIASGVDSCIDPLSSCRASSVPAVEIDGEF